MFAFSLLGHLVARGMAIGRGFLPQSHLQGDFRNTPITVGGGPRDVVNATPQQLEASSSSANVMPDDSSRVEAMTPSEEENLLSNKIAERR